MDTSGRATRVLSKPSDLPVWPLVALLFFLLGGCATSLKLVEEPMVPRLDHVMVDVTTAHQIEQVLGKPQGRGEVSSPGFGLKEAWMNEVADTDGNKVRLQMLMVFLDDESRVYHGHLWFASGALFTLKE